MNVILLLNVANPSVNRVSRSNCDTDSDFYEQIIKWCSLNWLACIMYNCEVHGWMLLLDGISPQEKWTQQSYLRDFLPWVDLRRSKAIRSTIRSLYYINLGLVEPYPCVCLLKWGVHSLFNLSKSIWMQLIKQLQKIYRFFSITANNFF